MTSGRALDGDRLDLAAAERARRRGPIASTSGPRSPPRQRSTSPVIACGAERSAGAAAGRRPVYLAAHPTSPRAAARHCETPSCKPRRGGTRAAQEVAINNLRLQENTTMNAVDTISSLSSSQSSFQPSFQPSFQSIDPALLDEVAGGFDFGRMVNAGNSNVAAGATAGGAIGGTGGAIAGGIAGGTVAGAPTMGLGTVGGVLAGAAAGGTAGTTAGAAIGGGIGWIGGAASDAWSQIRGR
jgi:hypothetical protein